MTAKNIVSAVLLLFVGTTIVYLVLGERSSPKREGEASPVNLTPQSAPAQAPVTQAGGTEDARREGHKVIAYYFHGNMRCDMCRSIERQAYQAVTTVFADAIRTGALAWKAVNVDQPAHEHFTQDYELTSSSLVLAAFKDGRPSHWRTLEKVWSLVHDEDAFRAYVVKEVRACLETDS